MDPIMNRFVRAIKRHMTAEDLIAVESCLDCRNCGVACAWYLATEDPKLHPMYKKELVVRLYRRFMTLEGRLLSLLGLIKTPTLAEVRERMEYYWKCTVCGRCSLACPLTLSNRGLFRLMRAAYQEAGLSLENPVRRSILENTRDLRHSFGLTREQIFLRVGFFFRHLKTEVPLGVPGADYLFICPSTGNTKLPDLAAKIPQLLNAAGIRYTFTSRITDTGTEIDHIVVHHEQAKRILMEIEDEAERLGTPNLIIAECGCDVRTFMVDAARILGRELKVGVKSLDALLLEAIESGRLPVSPLNLHATLHDPCYVTRLSGMGDLIRRLLTRVCPQFTEMSPAREFNYCCNGGSGPYRLPENTELRHQVSRFKINQILSSKAEAVVTPCAVCMLTLNDICQHFHLSPTGNRMVFMLFEIVHMAAEAALRDSLQLERFQRPVMLAGQTQAFIRAHSVAGLLNTMKRLPNYAELAAWLSGDEIVHRFLRNHPEADSGLARLVAEASAAMPAQTGKTDAH